ncbi:intein [Flavobacterium sp. 270]|uniref:fibronectin type III domain-containing protein n=1 Tax=Flavobacterium sp. 270 TaxID=2512114 RepID=UPI001066852C|nr:fibronectin type III domain-containing protein [Flavobacterium sp. 270]TDW46551.1 intein [Flavobacterium sp. 270]
MKQVNFNHAGGFPLEQETLEKLQTAYRSELYEALKGHLSIETNKNYIIAPASTETKGWAIIHQYEKDQKDPEGAQILEGILYPIQKNAPTGYLKTIRTGTNLIYGTGTSETAYFDYEASYISSQEYYNNAGYSQSNDDLAIYYYDLSTFETVLDIQTIDEILQEIQSNIDAVEAKINTIKGNITTIENNIGTIENDMKSYLPLKGFKAMEGDLNIGEYHLSKLDTLESFASCVRTIEFNFGSRSRRGLLHPENPSGRAFVDSSTNTETSLTFNYGPDWEYTYIGGKVYMDQLNHIDNLNSSSSYGRILALGDFDQVIKTDTTISSLLKRITDLESKSAITTAVPLGMIAIWGTTDPIPDGWEEYTPLKGRMPVGVQTFTSEEKSDALDGDGGNGFSYYRDIYGSAVFPFENIGSEGGRMSKKLDINEIPAHTHGFRAYVQSGSNDGSGGEAAGNFQDENTGSTGGGKSFPILNPYKVVQFIVYTGQPKDTTAPTTPSLTASSIGNVSVTLNWTESSDNRGVTNYIVYATGLEPITLGYIHSYTVPGLSPGTSYSFHVVARDVAGNLSVNSNIVDATTLITDTIAPTVPTNLTSYLASANQIDLQWNSATDNREGDIYYELWKSSNAGTFVPKITTTGNSYSDSLLSYDTVYSYKLRSRDVAGNVSDFTEIVTEITDVPPGGGGGNGCFDVESLVTMVSGQSKKLKNIEIGDKLQGFSFPNEIDESVGDYFLWNGKLSEGVKAEVTVVNKRASVQPNYFQIETVDTTIKVTGEHPLLVTQDGENVQWLSAKNVDLNMFLIDKTGKIKAIESILFKEEPLEVILLDVEDVDNYIISGIVAHNSKPAEQH